MACMGRANTTLHGWRHGLPAGVAMYKGDFTAHRFSPHFHDEWTIAANEIGTGGFRYKGTTFVPQPGDLILFRPGEAHDGFALDGVAWKVRGMRIDEELVRGILGRRTPPSGPLIRAPRIARQLLTLSRRTEAVEGGLVDADLPGFLEMLATAGSGCSPKEAMPTPSAAIDRVIRLIRRDPTRKLTVRQMARAANMSRFHFSRVFERATGLTPHRYLVQSRLCLSERLLREGWALSETAVHVGFSDQSHFGRLHRSRTGLPPGRYRRQYLEHITERCYL